LTVASTVMHIMRGTDFISQPLGSLD